MHSAGDGNQRCAEKIGERVKLYIILQGFHGAASRRQMMNARDAGSVDGQKLFADMEREHAERAENRELNQILRH